MSEPTICAKCAHAGGFNKREPGEPWGWYCWHPQKLQEETTVDYVSGAKQYVTKFGTSSTHAAAFCSDVNTDGKCSGWEAKA